MHPSVTGPAFLFLIRKPPPTDSDFFNFSKRGEIIWPACWSKKIIRIGRWRLPLKSDNFFCIKGNEDHQRATVVSHFKAREEMLQLRHLSSIFSLSFFFSGGRENISRHFLSLLAEDHFLAISHLPREETIEGRLLLSRVYKSSHSCRISRINKENIQ